MRSGAAGFTLIELTVVMVLLGLLLAVVSPGLSRLYTRIEFDSALRELGSQIRSLPLLAYALGEEGSLAELAARHIELPQGWSLQGADAIYIRASGLCSGGTLEVVTPADARTLELTPPFCAIASAE